MNAEFSERLRKFRDGLGLSQDKLAKKVGIFQTTLNSYRARHGRERPADSLAFPSGTGFARV